MNDPGLDEPIQDASNDVEPDDFERQQEKEEEEERDFHDPSRWWFASTACPLIAGTFGPMANAFSICALAAKWRTFIPPGAGEAQGQPIADPAWLLAINSVSLACALAANLALLLNMGRRLSFAVAQPITIVGFALASFLLIAIVAVASTASFQLSPPERHALSQAFYYAIIAAAMYLIISMLMVITVAGALRGHYEKEFRLTISQRTLMLQTMSFMAYLLLGAEIFAEIEGWYFLDSVYWADFTCLTVGIGADFVPRTHTGRSLLFPFAIGGIVMVGLVIGSVRSLVLERARQKLEARITEKTREQALSTIDKDSRTIRLGWFTRAKFSEKGLSELQRREQEFNIMRRIQDRAEAKRRWMALAMSASAAFALWFVGAAVFGAAETDQGWSYFVSLYFAYTSLLTIGYGDFQTTSNSGKAFFVFWSLMAVPTLTILISNMGDTVVRAFSEVTIWLGSLTVLPEEGGARAKLRSTVENFKARAKINRDFQVDKPPGIYPQGGGGNGAKNHRVEDVAVEKIADSIEKDELDQAREAGERGDRLERDHQFYHYILAKEIRVLMKDLEASPPKKYSYKEWAYYLKLLGQDEADSESHRKPRGKVQRTDGEPLGTGHAFGNNGEDRKWSWLGNRSPLMSAQTETEWIVNRLTVQLEHELRKMESLNPQERKEPPPITMPDAAQLRKRSSGSSSKQEGNKSAEERV